MYHMSLNRTVTCFCTHGCGYVCMCVDVILQFEHKVCSCLWMDA